MKSHPAWVCGLKPTINGIIETTSPVTPCVGVWIETNQPNHLKTELKVTPCVGVWIETGLKAHRGV